MKNLPNRPPLAIDAAHQDDITAEFEANFEARIEAGTELRAHRRTTVTVERETLSVLTRRTVPEAATEPGAVPSTDLAGRQIVPKPANENPPASTSASPNDLAASKP
jgi:hypothetical protein